MAELTQAKFPAKLLPPSHFCFHLFVLLLNLNTISILLNLSLFLNLIDIVITFSSFQSYPSSQKQEQASRLFLHSLSFFYDKSFLVFKNCSTCLYPFIAMTQIIIVIIIIIIIIIIIMVIMVIMIIILSRCAALASLQL